jgi:uncharacterized protein YeeX (DUF496 family)
MAARTINKEDIDFLKALQNEMLTQDNVCQADPRFWVIRQTERIYRVEEDESDGAIYVIDENRFETIDEVKEYLIHNYPFEEANEDIEFMEDDWEDEFANHGDYLQYLSKQNGLFKLYFKGEITQEELIQLLNELDQIYTEEANEQGGDKK